MVLRREFLELRCDSGRIRTCDPQLRRLLLYPAELRAQWTAARLSRGTETRTRDLLLPKQARYQLRYTPFPHQARCPERVGRRVSKNKVANIAFISGFAKRLTKIFPSRVRAQTAFELPAWCARRLLRLTHS